MIFFFFLFPTILLRLYQLEFLFCYVIFIVNLKIILIFYREILFLNIINTLITYIHRMYHKIINIQLLKCIRQKEQ
jgi:hypothetical protein